MERHKIDPHRIYAAGSRQTYQAPVLVVDTGLWAWNPRAGRLRRAYPQERTGRHKTPEGYHLDVGVLVLRGRSSLSQEDTLEALRTCRGRIKDLDPLDAEDRRELARRAREYELNTRVAIPRTVLCLWEQYQKQRSQQERIRAQRTLRAGEDKQRHEKELELLKARLGELGWTGSLRVRECRVSPHVPHVWSPQEVVMPIRDLLALLRRNAGLPALSPPEHV